MTEMKGMLGATALFRVDEAGQVYNQTNESYISGETSSTSWLTCPSRSTGTYATHLVASEIAPSNCMTDRVIPASSNSGC